MTEKEIIIHILSRLEDTWAEAKSLKALVRTSDDTNLIEHISTLIKKTIKNTKDNKLRSKLDKSYIFMQDLRKRELMDTDKENIESLLEGI